VINGDLTNAGTASLAGQVNGAAANSGIVTLSDATVFSGRVTQGATVRSTCAGSRAASARSRGAGSVHLGTATLITGGDNGSTSFGGAISGAGA
jgi:hypothetical protein